MAMYAKRKGDRIVCGVSGCGVELARVYRLGAEAAQVASFANDPILEELERARENTKRAREGGERLREEIERIQDMVDEVRALGQVREDVEFKLDEIEAKLTKIREYSLDKDSDRISEDVAFTEEWQPRSDGVWEITPRARRLAKLNRSRQTAGLSSLPVERHSRPMIDGAVASDIMLPVGDTVVIPPVLPVDCICPSRRSCGMRQTLDRDHLGLKRGMYRSLEDFYDRMPTDLLDMLTLSEDLKRQLGSSAKLVRQRLLRSMG